VIEVSKKLAEKIYSLDGDVIRKSKLNFRPNMPEYTQAYQEFSWEKAAKDVSWFVGKKLNIAFETIDRPVQEGYGDKTALYWLDATGKQREYSFGELSELSGKFASSLAKQGIKKGDRVFIFLPRVPELYIAFLGILKLGAVAGTLFSAFGSQALYDRLSDSSAKMIITTPKLGERLKSIRDKLPDLSSIVWVNGNRLEKLVKSEFGFDQLLSEATEPLSAQPMEPDDPAFMLYTSGTTGKSKGVIHVHRAIIQQKITAKWILDLKENDVYWCTADPGWVTGISYGLIGCWSNKVTSVVYGGRFNPEEWYQIIEKYKVTVWYTAPTAVRMLMKAGAELPKNYNLSSLRYLNCVGEPLNPEAIRWGLKVFGLPFHDNWWQTETGSILIANYPAMDIKLGSMGKPFPGITAAIIDDQGRQLGTEIPGNLAIKPGWPSMFAGIWGNPERYRNCFVNNWYISGDKAYQDKDGYFWFIGRADDVIMTAGERIGPFEVESALVEHPSVVEAGVIGKPDPLRGEIIKAFLVLNQGWRASETLEQEIKNFVKKRLAGHAYPREIEFVENLPKTQSGKIMRRVLKAKELGLPIGDIATLNKE
jgi:acetyl-CoA synthetase